MKINTKEMSYDEVLKLPRLKHRKPMKPQMWLASIVRLVVEPTLRNIKFSYTTERMDLVGDQPCLILMNHCSFTEKTSLSKDAKKNVGREIPARAIMEIA